MHVVVTGGTGALGAAVVELLAGRGATCHVPAFGDETSLPGVRVVQGVDLTDPDAVDAFYAGVPELWASVHCAGGYAAGPIGDADLRRMMAMNAHSAFWCCRAAVRAMRGRGGRIVNVASRQALEPRAGAGAVAYTASKAAVAAMTQALAQEVAGGGILVNAIAPTMLDTPANRAAMPDADHSKWSRLEDVAAVIAFLVDPANKVARGAIIPV